MAHAWRIALPRLLLGALVLSAPGLGALGALVFVGAAQPGPAAAAAICIYGAVLLLLKPLVFGLAAVQQAVAAMAADEAAAPDIESWAPSIRELWLILGRWTRSTRSRLRASEDELEGARAVL